MTMNKKTRNKLIIISVSIFAAAVAAVGIWLAVQYQNDRKTTEVVPVNQIFTTYWGDQSNSSGMVASDYVQELYPSNDKIISEIFVQEGSTVAIGDKLLQYDKTKLELDVESKELAVKEADLKIDTAQKQLKKLQNTKPAPSSKPTTVPIPTAKPTVKPEPTIPPADVTLYSRLDLDSIPYAGTGTSDDPYIFLCTDDCTMTSDFLLWLLGTGTTPEPEPTPTPSPSPDDGSSDAESEPSSEEESEGEEDVFPTPEPSSKLVSPFAAIFEVREADSNYGDLLSAFQLDGTKLSAGFQISDTITGSNSLDSVADLFDAPKTNTDTEDKDDYDSMGYTAAELNKLIAEKKQEIKELQLQRKQAKLDLDRANLALENSTVLSNVDGVVKTLTDLDTAFANNAPFLVVSGDDKYYVNGVISENLLGSLRAGDSITANSWETGQMYNAQIVSISDYPLDAGNNYYYGGSGNPNSSSYEFTAVLDSGEGLRNGMYLDLTMNVKSSEENSDALYLWKPYLKDDESGTYVYKVGPDNRLLKQYVETGKSIYGGEYYEIKAGVTLEDYLAFPSTDVLVGSRVKLQDSGEEEFNPFGENSSSGTPESGTSSLESADNSSSLPDESGTEGEAPSTDANGGGGTVIGGADGGIYFKTENGGGVILD